MLLTQPWAGTVDPVGVLYALAAAVCWACYILLTQRVGDEVAGINGARGVDARRRPGRHRSSSARRCSPRMTPEILLIGIGLAILLPVVPFALELLRCAGYHRGVRHADGLEPAFAMIVGFVVLHQVPGRRRRRHLPGGRRRYARARRAPAGAGRSADLTALG